FKMNSRSKKNIRDSSDEDDEWLFDSILGYLSSPIWSIPIQHFLETNSSIFSPNDSWSGGTLMDDDDDDENLEKVPTEFIDVHLKYKDLVDTLINTFLLDLGVSYSQFLKACKRTSSLNQNSSFLELFEQIWSAENFRMFKSLMVRKNIELELQALILLQYQLGIIKSGSGEAKSDEDKIMELVIKKSADEYDSKVNSRNKTKNYQHEMQPEDYDIAKKLVKSNELVEVLNDELDHQEHLNRKILKENLKNPSSDRPVSARKSRLEDQIKSMKIDGSNDAEKSRMVNDMAQTVLEKSGGNLSQSEIERRADFMRRQRDILAEKKRVERQKQIDELVRESRRTGDRPMSSRAARSVLSGADPADINHSSSSSDEQRKKIEARKALAETLRKEVVNKKN
ncbi:cilia- and flagella-associated 36 isoform X1, partial [Brachionus plicatilis]